ncbi:GNAT family N-acetyltransferase [Photobacterium sp. GJ3]|uniref:GNAT family N-acetyltransferase n=1 Tax=Photobacterium sp. GJ3 TaxID=2829502 RepID=UPI001B8D1480|nr:GNAT family N-acetyltransferase [Photobacterium sp. GJ3]QUJ68662.1 GNAT family N-acetyltransferase [Photobacterium sp. GJ3]
MDIKLRPVAKNEFEPLFHVVKRGIYRDIESVFGWDDAFQRDRLKTQYQWHWFHWIEIKGKRAGLLCYKSVERSFHVHFLILEPGYQNQGFGKSIMHLIHRIACDQKRECITLSCFQCNERALYFYQSLNYEIVESDEDFISLACYLHC